VAGLILEKVADQEAATLITDTLIKPLGLTNTSFATTPEMEPPYSHGYYKNTDGTLHDVTASNPSFAWTAGAIVSTLADLAVWVEAITDGSLLSAETQAKRLIWTSIPDKKLPISYGLGIMDFLSFQGHNGAIAGYSSFMVRNPDLDTTIVCFTNLSDNNSGDANQVFIDIVTMLYPSLIPKP
jgi:D-alanyl-D-alanine carboxypeptidase